MYHQATSRTVKIERIIRAGTKLWRIDFGEDDTPHILKRLDDVDRVIHERMIGLASRGAALTACRPKPTPQEPPRDSAAAAPRLIITVEGGLIQEIYSTVPVEVRVCDYDIPENSFEDSDCEPFVEHNINPCTSEEFAKVEQTCRDEYLGKLPCCCDDSPKEECPRHMADSEAKA